MRILTHYHVDIEAGLSEAVTGSARDDNRGELELSPGLTQGSSALERRQSRGMRGGAWGPRRWRVAESWGESTSKLCSHGPRHWTHLVGVVAWSSSSRSKGCVESACKRMVQTGLRSAKRGSRRKAGAWLRWWGGWLWCCEAYFRRAEAERSSAQQHSSGKNPSCLSKKKNLSAS